MKVCAEPGCPAIQREPRCKDHRSQYERQRGTRQARGYDADYDRVRRADVAALKAGAALTCWRCGKRVEADDYSLGHCDDDRSILHGPEHLLACNLANTRGGCPHESHISSVR